MSYDLFISCPRGLEYLLEEELKSLGLNVSRVNPQGVYGAAALAVLYRLCLWSRLANRIHLILCQGTLSDEASLRQFSEQFPWETIFSVDDAFAVSFHGENDFIRHTMFGAQVVKDGIVDHFRRLTGTRPSVNKIAPHIHLQAHLKHNTITLSLDLSGTSLHQRAYRLEGGAAPLKENLAAALLIRAGWPQRLEQGDAFHDPCCGSGTLAIEAALMATHRAPGLLRQNYGFTHWRGHDASLWHKIKQEALAAIRPLTVKIVGSDVTQRNIQLARDNAERAGVLSEIVLEQRALKDCRAIAPKGLLLCNPPYGARLGDEEQLMPLYQTIGQVLASHYQG